MTTEEPHTLAGAYALDALDPIDSKRFERHLADCAACTEEVTELRETTARLGTATAVPPPPGMKDKVLAAAARTSQHQPAAPARFPRRIFLVIPAAAAAGALIAIAAIFGVASSDANQRLTQAQRSSVFIAAVLTAADAKMMTGTVSGGGSATIVMSHHMAALVFTAAGLPAVSRYELWLVGPRGEHSAEPVTVSGHGMVAPMIAGGLRPGDHLMLISEPAGGTVLDIRL